MTATETLSETGRASSDYDPLAGIQIIDCDSHLTEPPDLWTARAPAGWRDRMPVQQTVDGVTGWYHHDELWCSTGANTIAVGNEKVLGTVMLQPFDRIDPSAWSVEERLALLDVIGVYAQILYPNGLGFSSNHIFAIDDEEERTAILRTYNDFLLEVQDDSGGRLLPQALLPIWDMDLTITEMKRLLDEGMTGFTLSDRPELLGLPELPEPYFAPMWDLFDTSGAVANFHIGSGGRREEREALRAYASDNSKSAGEDGSDSPPKIALPCWRSFGTQRGRAIISTHQFMSNVRIVVNLCMSNLFDRYENLKIVSAESGIGWVPFILESMEFQFDETVTRTEELSFAKRRPTEYFHDHMFVMFWFEESAPAKLIEEIGVRNVLVETDIPHPTCLYPGTRERFARTLDGATPEVRRRVLQDNAAGLYGIDLGPNVEVSNTDQR